MAAMSAEQLDLILTSTLLTKKDDQDLVAHLRQTPALRHVPILTIPLVTEQPDPRATPSGLMSRLRRRRPLAGPAYDFSTVAARIEAALEQSRIDAATEFDSSYFALAGTDARPAPDDVDAPLAVLPTIDEQIRASCGLGPTRTRAQRWTSAQLPWLASVKLSWGLEVRLLNISSSGLLVESGVSLTPGSTTTFQLTGPSQDMVVPARVVRSRVATVNSVGVRYHAAAVFDNAFAALTAADTEPIDPAGRLAELVAAVRERSACGAHPADLRAEFEAGVLGLVTAREVRIRDVPVVENDGRESVYFTIPAPDTSPAVLQVTFELDYQPGPEEFDALEAASAAAATVLHLTETAQQVSIRTQTAPRHTGAPIRLVHTTPMSPRELRPTA